MKLTTVLIAIVLCCIIDFCGVRETATAEKPPYAKVDFCGNTGAKASVLYSIADQLNKVCTQVNSIDCSQNIEEFFGAENKDHAINKINKIFCKTDIRITNCWPKACGNQTFGVADEEPEQAEYDPINYWNDYYYYDEGYYKAKNNTFQPVEHDKLPVGTKKLLQMCGVSNDTIFEFPKDSDLVLELMLQLARYSGHCDPINIDPIYNGRPQNILCAVLQSDNYLDNCLIYPFFMYNSMFSCNSLLYSDCIGFVKLSKLDYELGGPYDFGEEGNYTFLETSEGGKFVAQNEGMKYDSSVPHSFTFNVALLALAIFLFI